MIASNATHEPEHVDQTPEAKKSGRQSTRLAIVFICLLAVALLSFGRNFPRVGIYLDEWQTIAGLHFCDNSLISMIGYMFQQPRTIVRPIEAPYFGTLYYFFHENPLGYHLVNDAFEVAGAFFLYLTISRLTGANRMAFLAAVFFLIFPSHDTTHYSIISTSIVSSLFLFTLSLWQFIVGIEEQKKRWIVYSAVSFFLSVYNYELCLPLVSLYPAIALYILWKKHAPDHAVKLSLLYSLPAVAVVISMVVYRKFILPALHLGWSYVTVIDFGNFMRTMAEGVKVTISPWALNYYLNMARNELSSSNPWSTWLTIAVAIVFVIIGLLTVRDEIKRPYPALALICIGILGILSGYTIYGLSPEHLPVLDSSINRVNAGPALGAVILIAGLIGIMCSPIPRNLPKSLWLAALASPLIGLFMLADWEFVKPWTLSWQLQKHIMQLVQSHSSQLHSGDSIIIADTPRWVMWSPVFDGVWDFESMVKVVTNNQQIKGGVVSDRMVLSKDNIQDISSSHVCETYPFHNRMFILVPSSNRFQQVHEPRQFIEEVRAHGLDFGLDTTVLSKWQTELDSSSSHPQSSTMPSKAQAR